MKDVEIWLPHDETTELVALRTDAPVEPAPAGGRPVWLHHGSSISHGSNAARPTGDLAGARRRPRRRRPGQPRPRRQRAARPVHRRARMRDTPADLISVKIGINLVNTDLMRLRAFTAAVHGFLDTIREGHPTTPLLVVSPLLCPIHEDIPGPSAPDLAALAEGRLASVPPATRAVARREADARVVREELARIVAQRADDDPHLHYLDGRELYGEADHGRLPLPDALHPDAATHQLIGERFARLGLSGTLLRRGDRV